MNVQTKYLTTGDEFLRWNKGREGKREFVKGRVVEMMIHTTRNHARIASNLVIASGRRLDLVEFDLGSADFGVKTPSGVRYPDVYVDKPGEAARAMTSPPGNPFFSLRYCLPRQTVATSWRSSMNTGASRLRATI